MAAISLKLSDAEKAKYDECAKRDGIALSAWLRNAANAYCVEPAETPVKLTKRPDGDYQAPTESVMPTGPISVGLVSKDAVKSRAERLGLDKKPKAASELFKHMLPEEA
jgi:hypothetical protein